MEEKEVRFRRTAKEVVVDWYYESNVVGRLTYAAAFIGVACLIRWVFG